MRITFGLSDEMGCGHYRCIYPGQAIGDEAEVTFAKGIGNVTTYEPEPGVPRALAIPEQDYDVLVMQRPMRAIQTDIIKLVQAQGIACVVDVDDDFSCLHPRHALWGKFQPPSRTVVGNPVSNREHLARCCAVADLVTVTTPALAARYGGHGRVAVLPNYVPRKMLGTLPESERDGRSCGWAGTVATHPTDLGATRGGVAMALAELGARFVSIGIEQRVAEDLQLGDVEFAALGPREFGEYPHALASLDVGIAPLDDVQFNRAKSALKGLEMAAVGVPFVASPLPDYQRIAADGIGLLAQTKSRKWKQRIVEAFRDRDELARQGRAAIIDSHLYEDHAWRWLEAYEAALVNRRGAALV